MTIKHLLEVVNCPGVEVSWFAKWSFLLVGCYEASSPHPNEVMLLKSRLVVTTSKRCMSKQA
ncbi:hypothetical protein EXN66_Car001198 [Channa argus]|uniref:Uncharacterized protein n=1 Tax=Channa argus TaxID=215402 RepID=A0A6G1QZR8_CHAAH|nr:hypothetical protein EXN66_Car001198 [Channa argus]